MEKKEMALRPGGILRKKYRILKHLGSGRFGSVYLAETIYDQGEKVIVKEFSSSGDNRRKSVLEGDRLGQMVVPRLLERFTFSKRYYQVFEFVPAVSSLRELLDKSAPLPEDTVISSGLDLSKILKTLHSQGIIHRDIKPSNILITPDRKLTLIDFGIAALATDYDRIESAGSAGYAAPEQYHGKLDPRSDIYSLGVVLYEMLTGHRSKGRFSFTPIQEANPNVSNELAALIQKCLQLDISKRPSADEVYDTLSTIRRGRERRHLDNR